MLLPVQDDGLAIDDKVWAEALLKIKRKDPSIYDASTKLFAEPAEASSSEDDDDDEDGAKHKKSKHKRQTLREVLYTQVPPLLSRQLQISNLDTRQSHVARRSLSCIRCL